MAEQTTQQITTSWADITDGNNITMSTGIAFRNEGVPLYGGHPVYIKGSGTSAPTDDDGSLVLAAGEGVINTTMEQLWPGAAFTRVWAKIKVGSAATLMFNHG